jgi:8-oxo-dGTP pyrophosphatase MutT (NUDIX family)
MGEPEPRPWRILSSRYAVDDRWLRLRVDTIALPDGTQIEPYYVRESRGFAIVAALTASREIVLVRQYKHGAGVVVTELPAGVIDADETAADCARRELAEETGYAGDAPRLLRSLYADPTSSNGRFSVFVIERARPAAVRKLDVTEEIAVDVVPLAAYGAMLRDGRIDSGPQVAAGYIVLEALGAG